MCDWEGFPFWFIVDGRPGIARSSIAHTACMTCISADTLQATQLSAGNLLSLLWPFDVMPQEAFRASDSPLSEDNLSHCQLNFLPDLFCVVFDCNYKNKFLKWMGMPQTRIMSFVKCWQGKVQTAHGSRPVRTIAWLVSGSRLVREGHFFQGFSSFQWGNPAAATLLTFRRFRTCLIWP